MKIFDSHYITSVQELGAAIRRERKRQKGTQFQLAFAAGEDLRFICDLERG